MTCFFVLGIVLSNHKVVSTRSYDERLDTVANVRRAGVSVCCGGIIGLGESKGDRAGLLHTLATMEKHPESVPINALVPVAGTPLGDAAIAAQRAEKGQGEAQEGQEGQEDSMVNVTWRDMVRMISAARILMPRSMVRLSAGRVEFGEAEQV